MEPYENQYEIKMVVSNPDNKYSQDEVLDMFIEWAESKDLVVYGSIKTIE